MQASRRLLIVTLLCAVIALALSPGMSEAAEYAGSLYFYMSSKNSLVRVNPNSKVIESLEIVGKDPDVSPNGLTILYKDNRDQFYTCNLATKAVTTYPRDRGDYTRPVFISDTEYAYAREDRVKELVIKSVGTSEGRRLTHRIPERLHISSNCGLAAVPSVLSGSPAFVMTGRGHMYHVTADGAKVLFSSPEMLRYPAVSPDGRKVAFTRDDLPGIWLINIDGSGLTRLTPIDGMLPVWSPDGRHISFTCTDGAQRGLVYVDVYDSSKTSRGAGTFVYMIVLMRSDGTGARALQAPDGKMIRPMGVVAWR